MRAARLIPGVIVAALVVFGAIHAPVGQQAHPLAVNGFSAHRLIRGMTTPAPLHAAPDPNDTNADSCRNAYNLAAQWGGELFSESASRCENCSVVYVYYVMYYPWFGEWDYNSCYVYLY